MTDFSQVPVSHSEWKKSEKNAMVSILPAEDRYKPECVQLRVGKSIFKDRFTI